MKKYERPVMIAADELAEGVYLLSGGEQYTLGETLDAANGAEDATDGTTPDEAAGLEDSVGGTDTPEADAGGADTGDADTDSGAGAADGADTDTGADAGTDVPAHAEDGGQADTDTTSDSDAAHTDADADVQEAGDLQGSMVISCDSKYMNGVWQAPSAGPWGDVRRGCQEVLGCTGCPANKGDGCGLQDAGSASRYFREIGSLMPEWEASGKLPTDSPYGI